MHLFQWITTVGNRQLCKVMVCSHKEGDKQYITQAVIAVGDDLY